MTIIRAVNGQVWKTSTPAREIFSVMTGGGWITITEDDGKHKYIQITHIVYVGDEDEPA